MGTNDRVFRTDSLVDLAFLLALKATQHIPAQNINVAALGDLVPEVFDLNRSTVTFSASGLFVGAEVNRHSGPDSRRTVVQGSLEQLEESARNAAQHNGLLRRD